MPHRTCKATMALILTTTGIALAGCTVDQPDRSTRNVATHQAGTPHELCDAYFERGAWTLDAWGPVVELTPTACARKVEIDSRVELAVLEIEMLKKYGQHKEMTNVYGVLNQLECHIRRYPDKPTWNLEPQRPFVGLATTLNADCNPSVAVPERPYY